MFSLLNFIHSSTRVTWIQQQSLPKNRLGFSLIEVVLAVGMVSFALLSVTALLPQGLVSIQNAETLQATGNIANQLRGQMQQLSFAAASVDSIQELPTTTYYYTTDGIQTDVTGAYYKATFSLSTIDPSYTPVNDASFNANNAQSVMVTLSYPPAVWNKTVSFSLLVARQTGTF